MQKKVPLALLVFFTIAGSIFWDFRKTGILGTFVKSEITPSVDKILSSELHTSEKECTVMKFNAKFGYKINYLNYGITFALIE